MAGLEVSLMDGEGVVEKRYVEIIEGAESAKGAGWISKFREYMQICRDYIKRIKLNPSLNRIVQRFYD